MVRSGRVNHEVNEHTGWYNHWGQVTLVRGSKIGMTMESLDLTT